MRARRAARPRRALQPWWLWNLQGALRIVRDELTDTERQLEILAVGMVVWVVHMYWSTVPR